MAAAAEAAARRCISERERIEKSWVHVTSWPPRGDVISQSNTSGVPLALRSAGPCGCFCEAPSARMSPGFGERPHRCFFPPYLWIQLASQDDAARRRWERRALADATSPWTSLQADGDNVWETVRRDWKALVRAWPSQAWGQILWKQILIETRSYLKYFQTSPFKFARNSGSARCGRKKR
jgi:hypothetical protein